MTNDEISVASCAFRVTSYNNREFFHFCQRTEDRGQITDNPTRFTLYPQRSILFFTPYALRFEPYAFYIVNSNFPASDTAQLSR
jgi:hypothetical protein